MPLSNPKDFIGSNVAVVPLLEQTLGSNLRTALLILWGVVACVLLISCANVANLLLARAADRQKELAIRLALGVDRIRIVRQLVTESLILAIAGGTVGILLAKWTLSLLIAFNADHVPRLSEARLDWTSLGFTLIVACITGVLFGLAPALQITRTDLYTTLKDAGKGGMQGRERRRMREILVISQVALSMISADRCWIDDSQFRANESRRPWVSTRPTRDRGIGFLGIRFHDMVETDRDTTTSEYSRAARSSEKPTRNSGGCSRE